MTLPVTPRRVKPVPTRNVNKEAKTINAVLLEIPPAYLYYLEYLRFQPFFCDFKHLVRLYYLSTIHVCLYNL